MISIKEIKILHGMMLTPYHYKMIELVEWVYDQWGVLFITSGYRKGDPGVHGQIPCRGMDLRENVYSNAQKVVDEINSNWQYDYMRPDMKCALLHGKAKHIHLQVHPRTRPRYEQN